MKYMLLIYGAESAWTPEERHACMVESTELCQELEQQGKFLGASPLRSVTAATSIQRHEGKVLITDGPFAETTEQLGGYFLIDVENLDEAIAIAQRVPGGRRGTVEIRPLEVLPDLPSPH